MKIDYVKFRAFCVTPGQENSNKPNSYVQAVKILFDFLNIQNDSINDNDIIPIALEITPPCDFSQDKKNSSKLSGGFIKEITIQNEKTIQSLWKKNKNKYHYDYDFRYFLWPIKIPEYNNYCFICFDFHFEETLFDDTLLSKNNFELLFRTKKLLFADILQKYSSNKARLGTSFFNLK